MILCLWGRVGVQTSHSTQKAKEHAAFFSQEGGGYAPISVQLGELDPLHWFILSSFDYKYSSLEVKCSVSWTFFSLCFSAKWPLVAWRGMVAEGFFLCAYKEHHSKACPPPLHPHSPWDRAVQWRDSLATLMAMQWRDSLATLTQDCKRQTANFSTALSLLLSARCQPFRPALGGGWLSSPLQGLRLCDLWVDSSHVKTI